jgi:hypothetical protein
MAGKIPRMPAAAVPGAGQEFPPWNGCGTRSVETEYPIIAQSSTTQTVTMVAIRSASYSGRPSAIIRKVKGVLSSQSMVITTNNEMVN